MHLDSAKFLVRKAGEAFTRGEYDRARDLTLRSRGVLVRYGNDYSEYFLQSIDHGMSIFQFTHEFGEMGFKVGVVGLIAALATPVVGGAALGGAATGGTTSLGAFPSWFVTSMGGASAYGIASSLKRGVYSLIDGEKVSVDRFASRALDNQQIHKDFEDGLFASSAMYFIPPAAMQGEILSAGLQGIKRPLMALLPVSTVQGVHGGAEMMAKGGTPLEIGAATAMGFAIPYAFKGLEAGLSKFWFPRSPWESSLGRSASRIGRRAAGEGIPTETVGTRGNKIKG